MTKIQTLSDAMSKFKVILFVQIDTTQSDKKFTEEKKQDQNGSEVLYSDDLQEIDDFLNEVLGLPKNNDETTYVEHIPQAKSKPDTKRNSRQSHNIESEATIKKLKEDLKREKYKNLCE